MATLIARIIQNILYKRAYSDLRNAILFTKGFMMKNRLLIVWSSQDKEVAEKLVLMYSSVMLPRNYWDEAILMIWGPSAKLLSEDTALQKKVQEIALTGVKLQACVVCTDDYGVSDNLEGLGVELIHTGEMLTHALQNNWKVITF